MNIENIFTNVIKIDKQIFNIYQKMVLNDYHGIYNDDYIEHFMHGNISLGENGKVDINVDTGNVYIEGAEGTSNSVGGARIDLTIKDSEFERISVNDSDVTLDGVHDRTLFFETDTDVSLNGKSTLNQNNSSIDVNEE